MNFTKLGLTYFLIFLFGGLARYFVAVDSSSGDLDYYLGDVGLQVTLLGVQKSVLFMPVRFFEEYNSRLMFLSFAMSFLSILAVASLSKLRIKQHKKELLFSFLLAIFFIQIDMHLVRQQIGLYLFVIVLYSDSRFRYIGLIASVLYHEVFLIFLLCGVFTPLLQKKFSISSRTDSLLSLMLIAPLAYVLQDPSLILLAVVLLTGIVIYVSDPSPKLYVSMLLLVGILMVFFEVVSLVNIDRYIGVVTAYCLFMMVFDGSWGKMQTRFKMMSKFAILLAYSGYYAISI